jgi:hypothetical protein
MRRKGASLLLLVLLLLHCGVALAATPVPPGPDDPLTGDDEIYPLSLRYREQVDDHLSPAQMLAPTRVAALSPACGRPVKHDGPPPVGPAGNDLLFSLKSLRW